MSHAPIGIVMGSSLVVAVVPEVHGVRICSEPIVDQARVEDAVRALSAKNGLRGRQAIAALPARLCWTGIRQFPVTMPLKDRIANVRLTPDDSRFAGQSDQRAVVGAALDSERSLIGIAAQLTIEQFVSWLRAGGLRPLRLVSEAVGWKEALSDRYDGIVIPDVRSGTVIIFSGDYPRAEFFSSNERGAWYDHAGQYVGKLRADSKGAIALRNMALSDSQQDGMVKTLRERLQCDILEVPTLRNPIDGSKELGPTWLLPYGLARVSSDPLDFLRAIKEYRLTRFLEDRRQQFTFVGAAAAIATAVLLLMRAGDSASYQTVMAQQAIAQQQLAIADDKVKVQQLRLGGVYGNIDPYVDLLLTVRFSGVREARCFSSFGNLIKSPAWISDFTVGTSDQAADGSSNSALLPAVTTLPDTALSSCVYNVSIDTVAPQSSSDPDASLRSAVSLTSTLVENQIDARLSSVDQEAGQQGITTLIFGSLANGGTK